jgi:hypothetical protein
MEIGTAELTKICSNTASLIRCFDTQVRRIHSFLVVYIDQSRETIKAEHTYALLLSAGINSD